MHHKEKILRRGCARWVYFIFYGTREAFCRLSVWLMKGEEGLPFCLTSVMDVVGYL
jgi:hypothetical protein